MYRAKTTQTKSKGVAYMIFRAGITCLHYIVLNHLQTLYPQSQSSHGLKNTIVEYWNQMSRNIHWENWSRFNSLKGLSGDLDTSYLHHINSFILLDDTNVIWSSIAKSSMIWHHSITSKYSAATKTAVQAYIKIQRE